MNINSFGALFVVVVLKNFHRDFRMKFHLSWFFYGLSLFMVHSVGAIEGGRIIEVGPQRAVKTPSEASHLAKDGDVVEIDAGNYFGDVAVWTQSNLTLRAKNGRARLIAQGQSAESKGIWVVRGGKVNVEGFEFVGATVPDNNGAGIRFEKGDLIIDNCRFLGNENGILTGGDSNSTLEIYNSEFGNNGYGDGKSHNLYVGAIKTLKVSGSYFHHAKSGHLLKSRASKNLIFYNRLTDEIGGTASYELEFPNGGLAYVVGNLIQQSSLTDNPTVISFGAEGYANAGSRLYLINNTLVDMRPRGGQFLRFKAGGDVVAINNLLVGNSKLESAGSGEYRNNFNVDLNEFVLAVREDFHLKPGSQLIGKAVLIDSVDGVTLRPTAEYQHPRSIRVLTGGVLSPGAMQ
jgi:hypothetical protein